jgi:hypothetical protein
MRVYTIILDEAGSPEPEAGRGSAHCLAGDGRDSVVGWHGGFRVFTLNFMLDEGGINPIDPAPSQSRRRLTTSQSSSPNNSETVAQKTRARLCRRPVGQLSKVMGQARPAEARKASVMSEPVARHNASLIAVYQTGTLCRSRPPRHTVNIYSSCGTPVGLVESSSPTLSDARIVA